MTFSQLLNAGVSEGQPSHLQKKLRLANSAALIVAFGVAIPFIFISWAYFPTLVIIPVMGVIVSLGAIGLHSAGASSGGRVIISLLPLILAATYNIGLAAADEPPVLGIYIIELGFSITVFLVFDLREKGYLLSLASIALLIIMSFHYTKGWWEPSLDATVIREGYIGTIAILIGVLYAFGNVFVLVYQNQLSENESARFLSEAEENHQKMTQSEQEMKASLTQLESAQEEEKRRQWASEGLTQMNSIMRDSEDMPTMSDQIIAQLVRYTKANQGGLFVVEEEGDQRYIRLAACYAYERKKYRERKIAIGEGLIGQAYLERNYIYLTDLPNNYVTITSGLGDSTPRALLIMPLMINEEVEGLLEIASFREFQSYEIEFVRTLGENIAATLRSTRVNEQTKKLLAESQQQAEEVRAQEEEMRQNMEEMQATQEQSERFRVELEESQQLLQEKLRELEAAQQETEEVRKQEKQRAEEQIKSRTNMMEKAVARFNRQEQQLKEEIAQKDAQIKQLTG